MAVIFHVLNITQNVYEAYAQNKTYERLKDSCMFLTGSWQILRGERAIRTLTWIQHWQPLSSPFLFFLHFLSFSLTHPFSRTYLPHARFFALTHSFPCSFSLEVSKSLYLFAPCEGQAVTWLVISHSSFPRPARQFRGKVFFRRDYPCKERYISPCVCVPAAGMGGTVWGQCDCMRELPVLQPIWQTPFFCVLTSGGNRGGHFPQPPCSTGITLV